MQRRWERFRRRCEHGPIDGAQGGRRGGRRARASARFRRTRSGLAPAAALPHRQQRNDPRGSRPGPSRPVGAGAAVRRLAMKERADGAARLPRRGLPRALRRRASRNAIRVSRTAWVRRRPAGKCAKRIRKKMPAGRRRTQGPRAVAPPQFADRPIPSFPRRRESPSTGSAPSRSGRDSRLRGNDGMGARVSA